MKQFFKEFKAFINRGNVMDMAVGIIIGGAFTSIVSSLVDDIINPFLGIFGITGDVTLNYGKFITAVIHFLIMALVVFLIVKALNRATAKFVPAEDKKEEAPTSRLCPMCKTEIAIDACRCPHCTSILDAAAMHELEAELRENASL